ncbi:predicted protein [Micromonas commoda]|uniref:N-acetyltransferase domain-containing protein n=1 Tax=Micromonas commoda (strain RCC299 / NOUM17 / CCMP2709) TaxID=296587 RepID=C1E3S2_MICCC|nr:predicted protein [Micromonas commoda]ACO62986.1 predicted protein [Micromonas commoda]|eukprot:XP_002501728.1 predicted protein [Micromonas commoda]
MAPFSESRRRTSRVVQHDSMRVRRCDHEGVRAYAAGVRRAHALCFPEERPEGDDEIDDEFFDRVTFTHDEASVTWFLLCDEDDDESDEEEEQIAPEDRHVVGFAAAVVYATSVYGMHVAVVPSYRGRGLGKWLMREVQLWAIVDKGKDQIQATVDASATRLLRYYEECGAHTERTGFGSADAQTPTVVRIARTFTETIARREVESSRGRRGRVGKRFYGEGIREQKPVRGFGNEALFAWFGWLPVGFLVAMAAARLSK